MSCKFSRNESYQAAMKNVSGDICHWKYIKREKVNGKWRYYYDTDKLKDDLGFDEREDARKQKNLMNATKALSNIKKDEAGQAYDRMNEPLINKEIYDIRKKRYDDAVNNYFKADAAYWSQKSKYESIVVKYEKTPIGKIESVANKAKNFVKDLFGL